MKKQKTTSTNATTNKGQNRQNRPQRQIKPQQNTRKNNHKQAKTTTKTNKTRTKTTPKYTTKYLDSITYTFAKNTDDPALIQSFLLNSEYPDIIGKTIGKYALSSFSTNKKSIKLHTHPITDYSYTNILDKIKHDLLNNTNNTKEIHTHFIKLNLNTPNKIPAFSCKINTKQEPTPVFSLNKVYKTLYPVHDITNIILPKMSKNKKIKRNYTKFIHKHYSLYEKYYYKYYKKYYKLITKITKHNNINNAILKTYKKITHKLIKKLSKTTIQFSYIPTIIKEHINHFLTFPHPYYPFTYSNLPNNPTYLIDNYKKTYIPFSFPDIYSSTNKNVINNINELKTQKEYPLPKSHHLIPNCIISSFDFSLIPYNKNKSSKNKYLFPQLLLNKYLYSIPIIPENIMSDNKHHNITLISFISYSDYTPNIVFAYIYPNNNYSFTIKPFIAFSLDIPKYKTFLSSIKKPIHILKSHFTSFKNKLFIFLLTIFNKHFYNVLRQSPQTDSFNPYNDSQLFKQITQTLISTYLISPDKKSRKFGKLLLKIYNKQYKSPYTYSFFSYLLFLIFYKPISNNMSKFTNNLIDKFKN